MYKLTVENLYKRFGDNEVLKGVSLNARAGDVVSMIGASGSGKSTMLRCINFLERADEGAIELDGERVITRPGAGGMRVAHPAQLQRLRTRLAMVFQHFNLWSHMTVLENITMAPRRVLGCSKKDAEDRARRYLDKVGLPARVADQYPAFLSGGQQQRVAIARALVTRPPLLLADEPTGNLDSRSAHGIFELFRRVNQQLGCAILVVTHDQQLANSCQRIIQLSDGHIVADGPS